MATTVSKLESRRTTQEADFVQIKLAGQREGLYMHCSS